MTRDAFISKQKADEYHLTHLGCIPWGIVFSIEFGLLVNILVLVGALFWIPEFWFRILLGIAVCVLVLRAIWLADKRWARNRRGANCPLCGTWLGGDLAVTVLETGRCRCCRAEIIDSGDQMSVSKSRT